MYEDILYDASDGIATITLNRPEKRNALRQRGFDELVAAIRTAGDDPTVGVIVIAGNGKAFCGGGDIDMAQTILTSEAAARSHFFGRMIELSTWVLNVGKPVVCSVHGACIGGGAELITFADYVIADETAVFAFNGTDIGGCSWWGSPQLLPLQVGLRRAEEILFFSERIDAAEAARIGLINRVVPAGQLEAGTDEVCQQMLDTSEAGLRLTKAAMRTMKETLLASMSAQAELNVGAVASPDLHAAFEAFMEGRTVSWRALRPGLAEAEEAVGG